MAKYDISSFDVMPGSISVGSESNIMFSIYNTGKTTLYNVKVAFEAPSISGGDTFLGKIEPGGTGNVDTMVTGEQMTEDDGKVKVILSYEDEAGNVTTDEKELELFVTEDSFAGGDMDFENMDMYEGGETNAVSRIGRTILIIVIVVVALVIALIVILKLRKKKKAARELADDLEDLLSDIDDTDKGQDV